MSNFVQDVKFGVRMLLQNPLFTIVATVSLGLGIGAVTAVYSMVSAVLLHPVPFDDAERLVGVDNTHVERGGSWSVSYPQFRDWEERQDVFEGLTVVSSGAYNLSTSAGPQFVVAGYITSSFFPILREPMLLGRNFDPAEDEPGKGQVAILAHDLWVNQFDRREDIIGEGVLLDGESFTIVGVVGPSFKFLEANNPGIWVPVSVSQSATSRGNHWLNCFGRLKDGVTYEKAASAMTAITQGMAEEHPSDYTDRAVAIKSMGRDTTEELRVPFLILLGSVGFVLIISCVNVANFLLARVSGRQREITVRVALGANRGRLIRQLLTESAILAVLGGGVGLLVAIWGHSIITTQLPSADAQFYVEYFQFGMNWEVVVVAIGVTMSTVLFFGLVPAIKASNPDLNQSLKEGGGASGGGRHRHRLLNTLVVAEVALALVLLVGAGLMTKSYQNLHDVDPGFDSKDRLTFSLRLAGKSYEEREQRAALVAQLEDRLNALGEVEHAGLTTVLPFSNSSSNNSIAIEGRPDPGPGKYESAGYSSISPGYAEALDIPLVKGRMFTTFDNDPDASVAIINETMAEKFWPGEDPIGKRFKRGIHSSESPWMTVVGVLGDVRHFGYDQQPRAEFVTPYAQVSWQGITMVVAAEQNPTALTNAVREIVRELDPNLPVMEVATMDEVIAENVWGTRFTTVLFSGLAVGALVLAMVGVYGVISYSVTQRTHEIGIRMALGAYAGDVMRLVVFQGTKLAALGVLVGVPVAFALTRVMRSLLYEVSISDPWTFVGVSALLIGVAGVASFIPARRATRIDPAIALRYE